ncbi:hypothetical protein IGI04_010717 [Brassica rapa subsp. trilocularis]|uniref:Uncharacterized protein n=1 Tax=Brassica rapa subsp. trilocularis TaxID=1813537 RepID=A0ABQ7N0Z0_BRACM|nr:hypothetical protein IGI04_010717 [Brassica rapa subsp. trilocularis]
MGSNLCCSRHPDTYESTTGNNGDRSLPTGDDKFLSDASTFSVKEQESQLKAARLEEQRLGREAEKVNSWVKHESARYLLVIVIPGHGDMRHCLSVGGSVEIGDVKRTVSGGRERDKVVRVAFFSRWMMNRRHRK